ncbi:molybdenum cofactor biosynthesis protein [Acidilobus sp.]|uniref:molybdenum cofactor biosynthesis protein n=1 Tax=Acidilobus sp. TaxID=1872109 RepID=UPI003D08742D
MKVKVKLYSVLREVAGKGELELELGDGITVSGLLEKLSSMGLGKALEELKGEVQVIVDGRPLAPSQLIPQDAKVIHVLPPSSGGDERVLVRVARDDEPVDLTSLTSFLYGDNPRVGAVAFFIGIVRGINNGEQVKELDYEHSEELMEPKLRELALEAITKFSLAGACVIHFVGPRRPGQLTMVVGVSGESRKNVFPALEWLVDHVKHEAPVWKTEVRESGVYYMVGDREIREAELKGGS